MKCIQCQTVIRNALKSSPNPDVNSLWAAISNGTNSQYDKYKNTKQIQLLFGKTMKIALIMN